MKVYDLKSLQCHCSVPMGEDLVPRGGFEESQKKTKKMCESLGENVVFFLIPRRTPICRQVYIF